VSRPSDLELMLYGDGELDEGRRAEVEAWLAGDATGRAKLVAMGSVGEALRDGASRRELPDGLMEAILEATTGAPTTAPAPAPKTAPADLAAARAARRHAEGMRRFYVVAATLVAAAAAVLVWTRHEEGRAAPGVSSTGAPTSVTQIAQTPNADPRSEHGVEVWSVDFGAASGAVLYVPSESPTSGTTTVVWLSGDESAEEGNE
jgi:anti-sigma factor RsiW